MPVIDYAFIDSVLEQHGYDRTRIIAIMQDIQKQYRYLPREVIVYIGEKLHMTPAKLYGVATFYKAVQGKCRLYPCQMEENRGGIIRCVWMGKIDQTTKK